MNSNEVEVLDFDDNNNLPVNNNSNEDIIKEEIVNNQNQEIIPENNHEYTNDNSFSNSDKSNKYHGYRYYLTNHIIASVLTVIVFIIFLVGYNFSKEDSLTYTQDSTVSYQVCLKENDYYKEKCINENQEYLTTITDTINADFNYSSIYQSKQNKEFKYYIKSKLIIKTDGEDAKELYNKEEKLTKPKNIKVDKNVLAISESISIPFSKYNNYAQKYKNDYSLIGKSNLEVSLVLKDGKEEKEVSSLTIPLTEITYNISKYELIGEKGTYVSSNKNFIKYVFIVLMIITLILMILAFYRLGKFLYKTTNKLSKYQKKLKQILTTYDRVIITLEDKNTIVNNTEVYTVKTFLELLDVRDTVDKPILYYKVNDVKTEFYVQDNTKTYKYVMKEADFENQK